MPASIAKGPLVKVGGDIDGYGVGVGNGTLDTAGSHLVVLYEWVRWIDTGVTLSPGWHHVALVIDASGHPTVYLDGSQVYSDGSSGPRAPTRGVHIGGYTAADPFSTYFRYFNGRTDEVALYNQALSATTIQQHYNSG